MIRIPDKRMDRMDNDQSKESVYAELDACLAELEAAKAERSMCPPAEAVSPDKSSPGLTPDVLKGQENIRRLKDRVGVLSQEFGWLMVDPRSRPAFKRMKST
jgi:hypothetical protein